ncbi:lactococcin 972 family bacteriocin [Bacillus thuringiensis]|uniref:lactococcin 972 family bacteriocin n=1 Tax=Bacillus thuringiensis TaxID=1428 RepID=UPI000BA233C0|nr:lactococcin 972 family bacteriocin [Bacillus thuringiensis]QFQ29009.1 lactococcin 972 family bacteriocin [Bacillus thuringiensis]
MKKLIATLTTCTCLGLSTISVSAATTEFHEGPGYNLDPIMEAYKAKGPIEGPITLVNINDMKSNVDSPIKRAAWESAGGGEFRVIWDFDRHTSEYKHDEKVHRSSASNNHTTLRSPWENPGDLASVWIKSSLWGNKANWDVQD